MRQGGGAFLDQRGQSGVPVSLSSSDGSPPTYPRRRRLDSRALCGARAALGQLAGRGRSSTSTFAPQSCPTSLGAVRAATSQRFVVVERDANLAERARKARSSARRAGCRWSSRSRPAAGSGRAPSMVLREAAERERFAAVERHLERSRAARAWRARSPRSPRSTRSRATASREL